MEEMCNSVLPTFQKKRDDELKKNEESLSRRYSSELEIHELRGRLDRRNALLDVIRKAYHRDVLVIKEYLTDYTASGSPPSLDSVPSIDLRETFRLFAPQECELRVLPCWTCGGQLEVIHRESARIVNFKHSIQLLEEKERDLCMEAVNAKVSAQKDRECLLNVMERRKHERDVLLEQILSLKHQVADRNALDTEVKRLQMVKEKLEVTLEEHQPLLAERKRLLVEIEEVKDDRNEWEAKHHQEVDKTKLLQEEKESLTKQLHSVQQENETLQSNLLASHGQCRGLEEQCSELTLDLSKSKSATKEVEACLCKAEQAIDELETGHGQEKRQMENLMSDLESKCTNLQTTIVDLEEESAMNAKDVAYYRENIQATLEGARRRGSIAFVPQNKDAVFATTDELICETESLRQRTAMLFNLLLGCIRSAYENCLVQEKLLSDNGAELHKNTRKLISSEPTNDMARLVIQHLQSADQSDLLDWTSILKDETDQRHILGNLQNRLQMGQFSLDGAFQKIYKGHALELRKCQDDFEKQIEERRSRIWELEKMLTEALVHTRKYEDKLIKMQEKYDLVEPKIDSLRHSLRKTRRECLDNNDIISKLKIDFSRCRTATMQSLVELKMSREKVEVQKQTLVEKENDVTNRDSAMEQLEKLLENITHKYAENERRRTKITHEAAIQAVPTVSHTSSHADFLPTPLADFENEQNKRPLCALVEGRIFNLQDENWPSRINVGSRGIQFRRALDKL